VSRPDFAGRLHVAMGLGARLDVPFGPLRLDWGLDDQGDERFEFQLGQIF
jgi:outer membrane protein assembly factor BamA